MNTKKENAMGKKITKCPVCSTKLKMINGRMTCRDCGYSLRPQNESISYGASDPADAAQRPAGSSKATAVSIGAIVLLFVGAFAKTGLKSLVENVMDNSQSNPYIQTAPNYQQEEKLPPQVITVYNSDHSFVTIYPEPTASGPAKTAAPPASTPVPAGLPESHFFRGFIEAVYGRDFRDITAEEYAAVTSLVIDDENKKVYYQLNHGETMSLNFSSGSRSEVFSPEYAPGLTLRDLVCFPGLERLDTGRERLDLYGEVVRHLKNLRAAVFHCPPAGLKRMLPYPENITELTIRCFAGQDLSHIEDFPNLQRLTIYYPPTDISSLKYLSGLQELTLIGSYDVIDFNSLADVTTLEKLDIQSIPLDNIDFVAQLPNLSALSICGSDIYYRKDVILQDISPLASCPGLTSLSLTDNEGVTDYSVIENLAGLTSLTLDVNWAAPLPSFRNLTKLESLSVTDALDLSPLGTAVNVTSLYLKDCPSFDLEVLANMQRLTSLTISEADDYLEPFSSLTPLTKLPNLTELDISGTYIQGNIEAIFGIPSLKYLNMDDCRVGIDFDAVPTSSLETLSMRYVVLREYPREEVEWLYLADHVEFFDHFPDLKNLYLRGYYFDNIDFVSSMPKLQRLELRDTDISDISPLLGLLSLDTVWCDDGSFLNSLPQDFPVRFIPTNAYSHPGVWTVPMTAAE